MRKLILGLLCIWQVSIVTAQDLSAKEADSIRNSLPSRPADTSHINSLVLLAHYLIGKPGEDKADLDNAASYLAQARQMSAAIGNNSRLDYILLNESFLWKERGRVDTAKLLCERALRLVEAQKDKNLLGQAYYWLSEYYDYNRTDQLAVRILLADSAAAAYGEAGMLERKAYTLKVLADLHLNNSDITQCLAECDTCLQIYEKLHFPWVQPIYDLIGSAYYRLGDYKKALSNGLRALDVSHRLHDSSMQLCEIEYNVSGVFVMVKDTASAIVHLSNALTIALLNHDKSNSYLVASELIRLYVNEGRPDKGLGILTTLQSKYSGPASLGEKFTIARCYIYTYTGLHENSKALTYINELSELAKTPGLSPDMSCNMYLVVINGYLSVGKTNAASDCLLQYQAVVRGYKYPKYQQLAYLYAFRIDTARKNFSSAVANLTAYNRIRDSLSGAAQASEISRLNAAYETSEKEKHIQALQNEQKLQQRALVQSNQFRNFAIGGVILSLLTIAFGYSRFRMKQEKNRQLETQKKELEDKQDEISQQNMELSRLLRENEWLLREVHHRVKNNLQIVKSLLDSQSVFLKDESAQNAIRESQHRVQAMSLIHQKLYNSTNTSTIYMPDYVNELVDYLKDSFNTRQRIYFRREIEVVYLDVIHAVPLGLIMNEIITNSIKYAFSGGSGDQITIRLFESAPGEITLFVADNGIGLPADFDWHAGGSFGFRLIEGMTEDLNGRLTIERVGGTSISLVFPFNGRRSLSGG